MIIKIRDKRCGIETFVKDIWFTKKGIEVEETFYKDDAETFNKDSNIVNWLNENALNKSWVEYQMERK